MGAEEDDGADRFESVSVAAGVAASGEAANDTATIDKSDDTVTDEGACGGS